MTKRGAQSGESAGSGSRPTRKKTAKKLTKKVAKKSGEVSAGKIEKKAKKIGKRTASTPAAKRSGKQPAATAKPKLLSGGNPQIPKADGDAPVQAYIEAMPGWKQDVGRHLDELVVRLVPQVRKAVRWNSPFYGIEGQGWFLSHHCFNKYIKVSFLNGGLLRPLPPVASKHADMRYFHIPENEPIDDEQLADWIRQAAALPGEELF
jgi:hypothetical protein